MDIDTKYELPLPKDRNGEIWHFGDRVEGKVGKVTTFRFYSNGGGRIDLGRQDNYINFDTHGVSHEVHQHLLSSQLDTYLALNPFMNTKDYDMIHKASEELKAIGK